MDGIPTPLLSRFMKYLEQSRVPASYHAEYLQWLRYYLNFSIRYSMPDSKSERVRLFCLKLADKSQTPEQQQRAAHAVSLYFGMLKEDGVDGPVTNSRPITVESPPASSISASSIATTALPASQFSPTHSLLRTSRYSEAGYEEKSDSAEWDVVLERLAAEIKLRHYSRKTLRSYAKWSRQFQRFLRNKDPEELSSADVKEYLTFLAVKCHVAASTQNQAFNSLLFLYRHALKKDFGVLNDVPRAKKSLYVPTVLSREKIDAILIELSPPYRLFVSLLP